MSYTSFKLPKEGLIFGLVLARLRTAVRNDVTELKAALLFPERSC